MLRRRAQKEQQQQQKKTDWSTPQVSNKRKRQRPPTQQTSENLEDLVLGRTVELGLEPVKDDRRKKKEPKAKAPAWKDDDDNDIIVDLKAVPRRRKLREAAAESDVKGEEYSSRLRAQFEKIHGKARWADLSTADNSSSIVKSSAAKLSKSVFLPPKELEVTRLQNIEPVQTKAVVQSVEFHKSGTVVLTAGLDKTLRLFQVDGKKNPQLQSVFLRDLPISSAKFCPHQDEIILAGRRKFFYSYDIQAGCVKKIPEIQGRTEKSLEKFFLSPDGKYIVFTGHDGTLIIVSNKTKNWVMNLKMNGTARNVSFTPDGKMLSSGGDGEVYVWDLRARDCVHKFQDEGCVHSTNLSVSADGSRFACGSDSGVVNVYDDSCLRETNPKPLKALMQQTTTIDHTMFNHDGQILATSSRMKKSSVKLVHVSSLTTFQNWPTYGTPLNYVHSMAFSPNSGMLAMGNDKGKVLLYRLNHFTKV